MSDRGRAANNRTRKFFGGPGIGVLAMVAAFFFIVPGLGKVAGLDSNSTALLLAGTAVCVVGVVRVRKRLSSRETD